MKSDSGDPGWTPEEEEEWERRMNLIGQNGNDGMFYEWEQAEKFMAALDKVDAEEKVVCKECGVDLTDDNWWPSWKNKNHRKCIECGKKSHREWLYESPAAAPYLKRRECDHCSGDKEECLGCIHNRKVDMVNHPPHYTGGKVECIEAIEAALTPEEFRGYCKGAALKYVWRERMKGGGESLRKAQWYLARLDKSAADKV